MKPATGTEWFDYISAIPEVEYGWMEWQAYEFAGRLLVPPDALREAFQAAILIRARKQFNRFCIRQSAADLLQNLLCSLTKHSNSCRFRTVRHFKTSEISSPAGCLGRLATAR
jgi:hypothetical protein